MSTHSRNTVFIQTNNKQYFGAELAKYAIESTLKHPGSIDIEIINVDTLPEFKEFAGSSYFYNKGEVRTFSMEDLQSFTLTRFMPPERMGYDGMAIVIDPDIFALSDIGALFDFDIGTAAIAACRKKDAWDTSVMLMDTSKLSHWKITDILDNLKNRRATYREYITLHNEPSEITELPRSWNHLDTLTHETRMIHTTNRLTQPWKTGLPIDFTWNPLPKLFGFIPREPIHAMLGKRPKHYMKHPDPNIEKLFVDLTKNALLAGAVSTEMLRKEVQDGNVRKDIFTLLEVA